MAENPFSKKFLHDMRELHLAYRAKAISEEEFCQRVDELKQKEAALQQPLAQVLLQEKLQEAEKALIQEIQQEEARKRKELEAVEKEKRKEEYLRQIQIKLKERKEEEEKIKRINEIYRYRDDIDAYTDRLERNAQSWQSRYTWLQIFLLTFSAGTTALAGIEGVPRWIVAVTGLVATISGGLLTTFKVQDRIYASRKAIAAVKLECQKYDRRIEEYEGLDPDAAYIKLSRAITAIQGEQMLQEVELWKPRKEEKEEREDRDDKVKEDEENNAVNKKQIEREGSEMQNNQNEES